MSRDASLALISIALAAFGVYRALYLPAMLAGPSAPMFVGYLLQAVFGIAAGVETWRGSARAPLAILLLGASIALTGLIEIALGVVAWLYALLGAIAALVVAWLLSRTVAGRQRAPAP